MDVYGKTAAPEVAFQIDDLLDLSNYDHHHHHHSDPDSTPLNHHHQPFSPPQNHASHHHHYSPSAPSSHSTDDLCVPIEDVAELEWLSHFVDDSYSDIPTTTTLIVPTTTNLKPRGNIRPYVTSSPESSSPTTMTSEEVRRCAHCASEKTPQWRAGPSGPKTLCNACGVRYKSGRLVPEYRPAASPTFVLTQHSNSHRKVMELRRQKGTQPEEETEFYHHHRRQPQYHKHDFEVC